MMTEHGAHNTCVCAYSIGARINDLGWPWTADTYSVAENMHLSEPSTKTWMKIDPYCRRQKCRPVILFWQYKIYANIHGGSPGKGCTRQCQGLSTTANFSVFDGYFSDTLGIRPGLLYGDMHSVVCFSVIPKRMTLNDPERLFRVKFCFRPGLLAETVRLRETIAWKLSKIDTYCQQCKSLRNSSFWQFEVCADIRSDSLERRR